MTRRRFRRIFAVGLILASIGVSLIPTGSATAETETRSTASEFELNGSTLVKYTGTATTVSVPSTVRIIGNEAFSDNSTMKTVNIPNSVEVINYAAFSGCNNLTKVTIPASVEEIGTAAFSNCVSLKEVALGTGVKSLGTGVFIGCSELSTVSATGNDYFVCDDGVIYDDNKEKIVEMLEGRKASSYTMPATVTDIYPYAFYGCRNLETVTISSNLDVIPGYSFSNCMGLSKVNIAYSVNQIDMKAFENCVNLYDVEIPLSVTFIHDTAFDGCPGLNVIAPEKSYPAEWFKAHKRSNTEIIDDEDNTDKKNEGGGSATGNNSGSKEEDKRFTPEGMISETVIVGRQAVFIIDNSSPINVKEGAPASPVTNTDYSEIIDNMEGVLQAETNGKGLNLPKFAIAGNAIANKAFYANPLTQYEFPEDITSIGDFAFARSGLNTIAIPEGVTHIGYGAFYHCEDLLQILVPDTVTDIEASAFEHTRMLENWLDYGSGNFLVMGDGILVAYRGYDSKIKIPEGIKQIGPGVFKDYLGLLEVTIPDSCVRICEEAFSGCKNLQNVYGGMHVATIEDRAFYGCPISTVRVPDSVESIGLGAFSVDGTSLPEDEKAVVFHGTSLPKVSNIKTTTRLSNRDFRTDSLSGIKVAIVDSQSVDRTGTVLDRELSGFSGLICTIVDEPNEYFNGTLRIIDCTLTAEEAASFHVPSSMIIYGKGYNFRGNELDSTLQMAREGAYGRTQVSENTFSFTGSPERYTLEITNDPAADAGLLYAYVRIYGDVIPMNITSFNIALRNEETGVYLSKLGKQTYTVSTDVPSTVPTKNLHVVALDEDGQLEDLPYKVVEEEGRLKLHFDISHTGKYGMYAYTSEQAEVLSDKLDDTPDTGDRIHPKWLLASGLLALGVAMMLIRGKE